MYKHNIQLSHFLKNHVTPKAGVMESFQSNNIYLNYIKTENNFTILLFLGQLDWSLHQSAHCFKYFLEMCY